MINITDIFLIIMSILMIRTSITKNKILLDTEDQR